MVPRAVKLGVGQDQVQACQGSYRIHQGAKGGRIIGGTLFGHLSQHCSPGHIHHHQPFEPVALGEEVPPSLARLRK